jgi:hypothetical protein
MIILQNHIEQLDKNNIQQQKIINDIKKTYDCVVLESRNILKPYCGSNDTDPYELILSKLKGC